MNQQSQLFGKPIMLDDNLTKRPVIQLDPNFKWCTPEFRAERNQWLADVFGYHHAVIDTGDMIIMSSEAYLAIRKESSKWQK